MKQAQLNNGKVALVDDEDWPIIEAHRWAAVFVRGRWYVMAKIGRRTGYLHRLVTDAPDGIEVDHWNHDGLDCQKANLRHLTRSQNAQNLKGAHRDSLTGVRGVCFDKRSGRYKARVIVNYQTINLGSFNDLAAAEQAAIAGRRKHMTHAPECMERAG